MTIKLTLAERAGLEAVAARNGIRPAELLLRFVRDLTGSPRNGGSDERDFADRWAERSLRPLAAPLTDRQRDRVERLESRAWRLQRDAFEADRREYLAKRAAQSNPLSLSGVRECGHPKANAAWDHGEPQSVTETNSK